MIDFSFEDVLLEGSDGLARQRLSQLDSANEDYLVSDRRICYNNNIGVKNVNEGRKRLVVRFSRYVPLLVEHYLPTRYHLRWHIHTSVCNTYTARFAEPCPRHDRLYLSELLLYLGH